MFGETKLQRIPQTEFPDFDIFSMKQKTRLHGLSLLVKTGLFNYTKNIILTVIIKQITTSDITMSNSPSWSKREQPEVGGSLDGANIE